MKFAEPITGRDGEDHAARQLHVLLEKLWHHTNILIYFRDGEEKEMALEMLMTKFSQFAKMPSKGIEVCIVKIEATAGIYIDNPSGRGLGHQIDYD